MIRFRVPTESEKASTVLGALGLLAGAGALALGLAARRRSANVRPPENVRTGVA